MNGPFAFCHSVNLTFNFLLPAFGFWGVLAFSDIGMAHCRQVETYKIMI
ncbi:Uncharacterised protein [Serratia quinivorans]|nr:Uncharacterised protein [Serratia quinivorans]